MKRAFTASKAFFTIIGVLFLFLAASCGGGGGGGDDGGKGQPLGVYDFNLSFLDDTPLQITSGTDPATIITLEGIVPNDQILGSIDVDEDAISFSSGPWVKATTNIWGGDAGIISINLDTDIVSVDGAHPTEGAVTLSVGDPLEPDYTVTFTISTSGSVTTVDLENNTTLASAELEWAEFEGLLWGDASDWERQASFAWYVMNFYFFQVKLTAQTIILIEQNDTVFPADDLTFTGDTFTGTPPNGFDATGSVVLSCTGGDGGPGSDFALAYDDYWQDDPEDAVDTLTDGGVTFVGFLENVDQDRDVITSTGFVPNGETEPGGVFFDGDGLTVYQITESAPDTFDVTEYYTITGRYSIMFYEQEQ